MKLQSTCYAHILCASSICFSYTPLTYVKKSCVKKPRVSVPDFLTVFGKKLQGLAIRVYYIINNILPWRQITGRLGDLSLDMDGMVMWRNGRHLDITRNTWPRNGKKTWPGHVKKYMAWRPQEIYGLDMARNARLRPSQALCRDMYTGWFLIAKGLRTQGFLIFR